MGITSSTSHENKYFGFRIYKIFEGGPLAESGLKELDNFIIPPEDVIYNRISFFEYIKNHLNKNLTLQIYSVVKRFFYTIDVSPRNDWGDQKNGFLGACVRYENWSTAHLNLLRVIKVKEGSVSERALNMVPFDDYIISIRPENKDFITLNKDTSDPMTIFQEVLQDNIANFIEIFIYNIKSGPRSVNLFLQQKNGEILGCDVAYGKLHELPIIIDENTDKNLIFKNQTEKNENIKEGNEDYVLEETKKILIGNISNRNKLINENTIKNKENHDENIFENYNKDLNIIKPIKVEDEKNINKIENSESKKIKNDDLVSNEDNIKDNKKGEEKSIYEIKENLEVHKEENNLEPIEENIKSTIDPKKFEYKENKINEEKIEAEYKLDDDKNDDIEIS